MSFVDERLLECVSYGTAGGPTFRTRKVALRSGIVRRNALRSRPLYRFNIIYKNLQPEDHHEVIAAFNACYGGVYSFRLKDWADFQATNELLEELGTGSPQTLQLIKTYTFGSQAVARPIRKPVNGTVTLTHNNISQSASVDYSTGLVTFTAPAGHIIRWSGEFDVPVMFEDDELAFSGDDKGVNGLFLNADVALIEDIDV